MMFNITQKRFVFNFGLLNIIQARQIFYFIPTICYVRLSNGNQGLILYFGNIFIEFVWLAKENRKGESDE